MIINIIEYFECTVKTTPQKPAVIDGDKTYSFEQLEFKAKKLANAVIHKTSAPLQPIAVYLPKSAENIIANIGTIYSGNFYSNLDTKTPLNRICNIITNISPALIITNKELSKNLIKSGISENLIFEIEELEKEWDLNNIAIADRLNKIIDTDPLCIINTSGSTGTPKGVVLNHKSFIDFTEWAIDTLKITDNEIIGSLSPFYFDIYSFELCLLMAKAATIVIIPDTMAIFPAKLIEYITSQKINFIFWVPTIMVNIANLDVFSKYKPDKLKKILFAGEVFPTKHLNYWRMHVPNAVFVNLYGPIEITLDCTYFIVEDNFPDEEPIPIGYPCRNTNILILNDENKPCMSGELGELCVRGTSLAMGYYNDPEKTAAAFVQNPLNQKYPEVIYKTGDLVYLNTKNQIVFAGRKDFQIKHLGYRIELGEIEHVLVNKLDIIDNACVLYNKDKKEITLFYEAKNEVTPAHIRTKLGEILPKYMLPTVFYQLPSLPRNPNGKIDRQSLSNRLKDNQ